MIITLKPYGRPEYRCTLQEAVSMACDGFDCERGELETIKKSIQNTQVLLAALLNCMTMNTIKQVLESTNNFEVKGLECD